MISMKNKKSEDNKDFKKRSWDDCSKCEICLINPSWITKEEDIWHGIKATMPPLSLLSIAAYLEERGRDVAIVDAHVERLSILELKVRISQLQPKIVGITVMTATAAPSNLIARLVKEVDSSAVVVMGGVHAEILPEECLSNQGVDTVVRGDGEVTFYRLCEAIFNGGSYKHIPGISFRDIENGKFRIVHNPPAEAIKDLNQLPIPAYHLVPMHRYYPAVGAYRKLPAINMLMTRGCVGRCSFCNSAKTYLRTRNAELVVEEIINLKKRYGIREIQFYDDSFTITRRNVLKFCKLMKKKKVGMSWAVFARVDFIDQEMVRMMKEAGCHQIMLGVESGDPEILKKMGKPIQLKQTERAVGIVRDAGIEIRCAFVYGCEGETIVSIQKTLSFALKLDPDLAIFNIATPYPGTQLYRWAKQNGYLIHEDWTEYELGRPVIKLPTVSPEEISKFYKKSFKIFYRRPKIIWRRIKKASSIHHWKDMIMGFVFIMFCHKLGVRDNARQDWVSYKKEDFFDYPFYKETDVATRLTYEVHKVGLKSEAT